MKTYIECHNANGDDVNFNYDPVNESVCVIYNGRQIARVDACEVYEMLYEAMSVDSETPSVKRRAKILHDPEAIRRAVQ